MFAADLLARIALLGSDALVLIITWLATWSTLIHARRAGLSVPLSSLLLRDGRPTLAMPPMRIADCLYHRYIVFSVRVSFRKTAAASPQTGGSLSSVVATIHIAIVIEIILVR